MDEGRGQHAGHDEVRADSGRSDSVEGVRRPQSPDVDQLENGEEDAVVCLASSRLATEQAENSLVDRSHQAALRKQRIGLQLPRLAAWTMSFTETVVEDRGKKSEVHYAGKDLGRQTGRFRRRRCSEGCGFAVGRSVVHGG